MGCAVSSSWSGSDDTCVRCQETGTYGESSWGEPGQAHDPMTRMTAKQYNSGTGVVEGYAIACMLCKERKCDSVKVYACVGKGCELAVEVPPMYCKSCGDRVKTTQDRKAAAAAAASES